MIKLTETTRIRVPIQEKRYIRFERHSRAHWRSNNSQLLLGGYSGQQTSIIGRDVFSGVRVTRSLVLYVCFVDRCLSFCTFSFGHCVFCSSSIYVSDCPFGVFKLLFDYFEIEITNFIHCIWKIIDTSTLMEPVADMFIKY